MYNIGVDLGGTNIVVGLINNNYEIVAKLSTDTRRERTSSEIIKDIATLCLKLIEDNKIDMSNISSIGIGSPGTCDPIKKIIMKSANINFENVHIEKEIHKYIDLPVYLENDANCAAYGEFKVGAGRGSKSTVVITLGTGVGGGVITNGNLLTGSHFMGGELGHMVIKTNGRQCACGRKGCLEAYCSAKSLVEIAEKVAIENKDCILNELTKNDLATSSAKKVFEAYDLGDKYIKKVIDEYHLNLSEGLINFINIFDPEIIVLGGGVSGRGDKLINSIRKEVENGMYAGAKLKCELKISELGNDAGLIGAGILYSRI